MLKVESMKGSISAGKGEFPEDVGGIDGGSDKG